MKEDNPYRSTVLSDTQQTSVNRDKSLGRWSWICAFLAWLFYLLRAYKPAHTVAVTVPTLVMWLAVGMGWLLALRVMVSHPRTRFSWAMCANTSLMLFFWMA
jgi:hypothetical protein